MTKQLIAMWIGGLLCAVVLGLASLGLHAQTFGSPQLTITAYKYANITTDATTTVKSGSGILHTICINTPAATETVTIYDNTAGSGTKIGSMTSFASVQGCNTYDVAFSTGLTIVTATAAGDITVAYY